jgi:putative transcriptional regulator
VSEASFRGKLLVAVPTLLDPNFARTVVLLLEHNDEGAVGVVLNRPSDTDIDEPLPGLSRLAASPPVVFVGGPVAPGAAICLARAASDEGADRWQQVLDRLGTLELSDEPDPLVPGVTEIRVFAGYAGWGPGQLEDEIEAGGWFVIDADADDALSPFPERLWRAVLLRQGGNVALFANYPPHPSLN